jgi:hypothetical protein
MHHHLGGMALGNILNARMNVTEEPEEVAVSLDYGKNIFICLTGLLDLVIDSVRQMEMAVNKDDLISVGVDPLESFLEPLECIGMEAVALLGPDTVRIGVGRKTDKVNSVDFIVIAEKILITRMCACDPVHIHIRKLTHLLVHRTCEIELAGVVVTFFGMRRILGKLALSIIVVTRDIDYLFFLGKRRSKEDFYSYPFYYINFSMHYLNRIQKLEYNIK